MLRELTFSCSIDLNFFYFENAFESISDKFYSFHWLQRHGLHRRLNDVDDAVKNIIQAFPFDSKGLYQFTLVIIAEGTLSLCILQLHPRANFLPIGHLISSLNFQMQNIFSHRKVYKLNFMFHWMLYLTQWSLLFFRDFL